MEFVMAYPENDQEIYNTVMNHLWHQGKQARDQKSCAYRTDDGLSCAVGCLIPDDLYKKYFEGLSVFSLVRYISNMEGYESLYSFLEKNNPLLQALQAMHDGFGFSRARYDVVYKMLSFRQYLIEQGRMIAKDYNLIPYEPPEDGE